jgi:hypothetical protein
MSGIFDSYVHKSAKEFFKNPETQGYEYLNRRKWLIPFYNACPYIFLSIDNEAAFVHGGLHGTNGRYIDQISTWQSTINSSVSANKSPYEDLLKTAAQAESVGSEKNGPLWSRYYAENPKADVCKKLNDKEVTYKMIVVGHCQTEPGTFKHHDEILREPEYKSCQCGGLVLLGCREEKSKAPRLAFVDIGMSSCFRQDKEWNSEAARHAEFLHLSTSSKNERVNRYYNVVKREKIGGDKVDTFLFWTAPTVTGGRRSVRRKGGKYRRTKRRFKARKF